jgi:hypothetical protein
MRLHPASSQRESISLGIHYYQITVPFFKGNEIDSAATTKQLTLFAKQTKQSVAQGLRGREQQATPGRQQLFSKRQ